MERVQTTQSYRKLLTSSSAVFHIVALAVLIFVAASFDIIASCSAERMRTEIESEFDNASQHVTNYELLVNSGYPRK